MKVLLFLTNYHPILTEDEIREEKKKRKGKKRIIHDDVLEQQFNALVTKRETLQNKKICL